MQAAAESETGRCNDFRVRESRRIRRLSYARSRLWNRLGHRTEWKRERILACVFEMSMLSLLPKEASGGAVEKRIRCKMANRRIRTGSTIGGGGGWCMSSFFL